MHDRGKTSFSCEESKFVREWSPTSDSESRANRYSSDLLLALPLFKPKAYAYRTVDFDTVRELAGIFQTSVTATAIRLAEHGPLPTMLVCYSDGARRWFVRGSEVPEQVWPSKTIEPKTYAYDLLKSRTEQDLQGETPASAWFDHEIADGYYIREHSLRMASGDVLSLLWWKDERMLIHLGEHEEAKAARRSDWREEE